METLPSAKSFKNAKNVVYLGHQNYLILEPKMHIMKMKTYPQWLLKSTGIEAAFDFCKFLQSIGCKLSNAQFLISIGLLNHILLKKLSEFFFSCHAEPPTLWRDSYIDTLATTCIHLKKSNFWKNRDFSEFWWFFDKSKFGRLAGRKWPKLWLMFKNIFFRYFKSIFT